ncbi:MAG: VWA domain-containing protein, partial [Thermomicrobiaceae bacterium]|nr:VWA domain-containing protein [Thermomicrobiaceae bacterium]
AVVDQIGRIEPEGGTEIYPALEEGFGEIQGSGADVKHVILFTDGKSSGDWAQRYDGLVEQMRRANVTLSTIAIGNDADTELLQRLAQLGGGRYHFTERAQDIPRVTLEETQRVGDRPMLEGVFQPVQAIASPIMRGLRPEDLPDVRAYAATDGKPEAQVVLTSDRGDPLLAVWQYGLGRVVAWTTDAGGSGTPDWTAWSGFDQFWFNVLRWALPDPDNRPFSVAAERAADGVTLTLRQTAEQGYVGLGSVSGTIGAGETRVPVAFEQAGPGEYRAHLRAAPTGAYRLDLSIATRDGQRDETFGLAVPYPAEYRPAGDGAALLASLSRITGGKVLDRPDQAFRPLAGSGSAVHYRRVWYVPVALALAAFVAEVARRLGVGLPRRRPAAR